MKKIVLSHIIFLAVLITTCSGIQKSGKRCNSEDYEIILVDTSCFVNNYYIYLKMENLNEKKVKNFITNFRKSKAPEKANIHIYDTQKIRHLLRKHKLQGQNYVTLADHFVACSTFDTPQLIWWYPFQDFYYKEQGGKNWKKE